MNRTSALSVVDPVVADLLLKETIREEYGLEMIPSENFVSEAVLQANSSTLTNKYSEGLPKKRYYGGNEIADLVEELAQSRAKQIFGSEFVNVQPHSGAQANQAAFEAAIKVGDTIMGMRLDQGGHLTHGSPVNFSGKHYKVVAYGVRESDQLIDGDEVMDLAKKHQPKMIICGASAYSRQIDFAMFGRVAREVGAVLLADIAHYAGLVAAGEYPSPIEHADIVTTTTHKTLRGPRSGIIMGRASMEKAVNKAIFPGLQGGPHMHTIAAKAVCFHEALQPDFKIYAQNVIKNARALSAELVNQGFKIVSGGTDSHLMLVDLRAADVTGKVASAVLDKVGITVNMNTVPFDPQPPMICSGIRLGTPALTTRGMGVAEMKIIARIIKDTIANKDDETKLSALHEEVKSLAGKFPLYRYKLS